VSEATLDLAIEQEAPPQPSVSSREQLSILVLAPTGRDAALIVDALRSVGMTACEVADPADLLAELAAEIDEGRLPRLGAIFATDDALGLEWSRRLAELLDRQPSWSDIPIVLLAQSPSGYGDRTWGPTHDATVAERLTSRGSVTVLDRPIRVATLISAARGALDGRLRQLEVRELIEQRIRAQQEAEQANRAKSEFLAVMSHELRTPLNAIMGYVNLLEEGCYGPIRAEQGDALRRISRAQRHLLGLINDVLNFARLEKGHVEYDVSSVSLADVVAQVGPLVEPQLAAKGLSYEVRSLPRSLKVRADPEKLCQVLLNLLSNAIKFTPRGGTIVLEVVRRAQGPTPPDRVFLRIADTGGGIPDDKLMSVFEPFVQVRADASAPGEGTGLGLAISRELARGMGGELRARSVMGRGSTFTVDLESA
jgi:signal transduction histidine kinase